MITSKPGLLPEASSPNVVPVWLPWHELGVGAQEITIESTNTIAWAVVRWVGRGWGCGCTRAGAGTLAATLAACKRIQRAWNQELRLKLGLPLKWPGWYGLLFQFRTIWREPLLLTVAGCFPAISNGQLDERYLVLSWLSHVLLLRKRWRNQIKRWEVKTEPCKRGFWDKSLTCPFTLLDFLPSIRPPSDTIQPAYFYVVCPPTKNSCVGTRTLAPCHVVSSWNSFLCTAGPQSSLFGWTKGNRFDITFPEKVGWVFTNYCIYSLIRKFRWHNLKNVIKRKWPVNME